MFREVTFFELKKYAQKYQPFSWDTLRNDYRLEFKNKNDLLISFVRYAKVMQVVSRIWKKESLVIDFGIFPGVIPRLFREFFSAEKFKYYGIGLMFSAEFVEVMRQMNVELLESELDPFYFRPKAVNSVPWKNADFVLFLDIIEHLSNPIYALDTANQSLKKGGHLVLTTDNITGFDYFVSILRGRSPLHHPLQTNMFYQGDWRPHFREYGKEDLIWVLENSGFTVITHEYFDRQQAEWSIIDGQLVHSPDLRIMSGVPLEKMIKRNIYRGCRSLCQLIGHFRNHQIVVAQKTMEISELEGKRPELQFTLDGWMDIRKKYLKEG